MVQRSVLITGGASGFGSHLVKLYGSRGFNVAFTYCQGEEKARNLEKELRDQGIHCEAFRLDISKETSVVDTFNKVYKSFGRIDVLINNAGTFSDSTILKMNEDQWDKVLDTNLKGVFLSSREAIKIMKIQNYGRIISIGSVVATIGAIGAANYAAAKAGLIGFNRTMAQEVAKYNITANIVALGYLEEGMGLRIPDVVREKMLETIPAKRFGDPENVAKMIYYFTTEEAEYVTGQSIGINGGLYG